MQEGEEEVEGLQETEGLGEKETSRLYGFCCSKPDNLETSTEDALSPRLPDSERSRHSDAIHCHLLVYHWFLFKPLHSSPGRAQLCLSFSNPSGAKEEREALSMLIASLDQRCLLRLAV